MEIFGQSFGLALPWIGGLAVLAILFWVFFRMSNPSETKKNPSLKSDQEKNVKDKLLDKFARGEISHREYKDRIREWEYSNSS